MQGGFAADSTPQYKALICVRRIFMLTSICGINWGDEGKGRMVDLLSETTISYAVIRAETMQGIPL